MLYAVWSSKGGSGASVIVAATAIALARRGGARLADLAGDQPAIFAMAGEPATGLADWLAAGCEAPTEALDRLAVQATPSIALLPRGGLNAPPDWAGDAAAGAALGVALRSGGSHTLVDVGVPTSPATRALVEVADASVMVTRSCYLALRRAVRDELLVRAAGVVLVEEPGRALGRREVADVLGKPVLAHIEVRPSIARAVDAGVVAQRTPAALMQVGEAVLDALGFASAVGGRVA